jgi:hypothetical protein
MPRVLLKTPLLKLRDLRPKLNNWLPLVRPRNKNQDPRAKKM